MSGPGFTVEAIEQGVPFRDRVIFADCHRFADPSGTAVLVAGETASRLREAAAREQPRETGGLLHGRVLRDAAGRYIIVTGFVQASAGAGNRGTFAVSPQATAALRAEAARRQPTADVVGWWHSHAQPSEYSATDRSTQRMWTQPDSVGLLVFAAGSPWAHAYLGPLARLATLQAAAPQGERERIPQVREAPAGPAWPAVPGPAGRRLAARRGAIAATVIVVVLVITLAWWLRGLVNAVNSETGQLSQIRQAIAGTAGSPSPPPAVSWSCVQRAGRDYQCSAPVPETAAQVQWRLNGEPCGDQPSVLVHLPQGAVTSVIELQLRVATVVYDLGARELSE